MPFYKVQVWIYREGVPKVPGADSALEVLLLKLIPERGGFWQPVTGGVDPGEGLAAAAFREASEETGLPFSQMPESLNYHFQFFSPRHQQQCEEHVFALEAPAVSSKTDVRLDPREHTEFQWQDALAALSLLKHPSNVEGLRKLMARKATHL